MDKIIKQSIDVNKPYWARKYEKWLEGVKRDVPSTCPIVDKIIEGLHNAQKSKNKS